MIRSRRCFGCKPSQTASHPTQINSQQSVSLSICLLPAAMRYAAWSAELLRICNISELSS